MNTLHNRKAVMCGDKVCFAHQLLEHVGLGWACSLWAAVGVLGSLAKYQALNKPPGAATV